MDELLTTDEIIAGLKNGMLQFNKRELGKETVMELDGPVQEHYMKISYPLLSLIVRSLEAKVE